MKLFGWIEYAKPCSEITMPKCPDCRDSELELIQTGHSAIDIPGHMMVLDDPYYWCPKCREKYDPENVEEL